MAAIEVSSLKKAYGSLQAVNSISFDVKEGEVFSLARAKRGRKDHHDRDT